MIADDAPISAPTARPQINPLKAWMPALVSISLACAVFGVAFHPEMMGAVRVWIDSTAYNHCFLVLPLVIVLLWGRREIISNLRPSPSPWFLALAPLLSATWMLAALAGVLEAEQLVVITLFELLLVAVLGWRVFRALLTPLLFLYFLVPFGAFLVPALQSFTTIFAVHGLEMLGIPVFADGFMIQIPEGAFEVAEACAGLRFLIASIVFGCFFSVMMYRSPLRRVIFIGLSIVVPIIANGLRAFGTIFLAHLEGSATAVAADHILYGWIFFTLVTFLLIAVGMTFAEHRHHPPAPLASAASSTPLRVGITMAGGLLLTLLGPAYLMASDQAVAVPLAPPFLSASTTHQGWTRENDTETDSPFPTARAPQASLETYRDDQATVTQFVALYPLPARGTGFTKGGDIADAKAWRVTKTDRATVQLPDMPITVNTALITRQSQDRLVWWFYVIDDRVTASTFVARLLQALTVLRGGTHVGAFIALSTDATDRVRADAALHRFTAAMGHWQAVRPALAF